MKLMLELLEPFDRDDIQSPINFEKNTLRQLVNDLFADNQEEHRLIIQHEKLNPAMMVLVNSARISDLDHKLTDGDEVVISRTISGG